MTYRTALVTGASSGIGRGLALALAARGTHVIVAARRKPELDSLVAEIAQKGGSAEALALDVARADEAHEAVRALDQRTPLDLVIANAGIGEPTFANKINWATVKRTLDVNLTGACATLAGALPGMVARDSGHLVGMASVAALRGMPGAAAYCATKAGLRTFLESLRLDLHGTGVHVTTLLPGFIRTPLTAKNKHPMPLLMDCDRAVAITLRAIDKQVAERAFPWAMVAMIKLSKTLVPDSLFVAVNRRANPVK